MRSGNAAVTAITAATPRAPPRPGRRPSPRLTQLRRGWHVMRANLLAMVGLAIILFFVAVAVYAATQPYPWTSMTTYCAYTPGSQNTFCEGQPNSVCVYSPGTVAPAPDCYQSPTWYPAFIAPTVSLVPFHTGPLPLGSFVDSQQSIGGSQFFNLYQGILRGADWTLILSFSIVIAGAAIGLIVGAISGYFGGLVDEALMRLVDIMLSIPSLLLVLLVVVVLSQQAVFADSVSSHVGFVIFGFAIVWWPLYARIERGLVLVTREQKYVEAARAAGASHRRILGKHIIPNSIYPMFVQVSLDVGSIPLTVGALVFLGFTQLFPSVTFPEWGTLSALSVNPSFLNSLLTGYELNIPTFFPWWMVFFPGLMLFLFVMAVSLFADGLRDALDPRLRQ
jgi:peptide/nickel transport system permease protein